jgi:gluconokinase
VDRAPRVLALDIGSGGPGAARFDPALRLEDLQEQPWDLSHGQESASLGAWGLLAAIEAVVGRVARRGPAPAAIAVSSMMHSLLLTDTAGRPLSPVSTWLDRTPVNGGAERIRQRLGPTYTARTGGRVHPSFPATRFARLASEGRVPASCRVDSIPSWVLAHWTGTRAEDESTASASGFLNLATGEWDRETLAAVDLEPDRLPSLVAAGAIAGGLGAEAAARTGLPAGLPVVVGGGDGFLAALGSGCRTSPELAITLGTSAAVRRFQPAPADTTASGLFCYRQAGGRFLVGGASSNGGNVIDWAKVRARSAGNRLQESTTSTMPAHPTTVTTLASG